MLYLFTYIRRHYDYDVIYTSCCFLLTSCLLRIPNRSSNTLFTLLHLQSEQTGLGTAKSRGSITLPLVKGIAAIVQSINLGTAFFLLIRVLRETVYIVSAKSVSSHPVLQAYHRFEEVQLYRSALLCSARQLTLYCALHLRQQLKR